MMGILDTIKAVLSRTEFMYDLRYEWSLAGLEPTEFKARMEEWREAFNRGESVQDIVDRELDVKLGK